MKYLSLLFIAVMSLMNAQNQRFTYEYRFAKDANKLDTLSTEMMALDVTEKGSKFYSWDIKVGDSIMKAIIEKQMKSGSSHIDMRGRRTASIRYEVTKKYPDFTIDFLDKFGGHSYQVEDTRPMNWQISPETQKIGEWECQKATTSFAGRTWDAWFTTAIPITDGPYKFRGLPGLIVRLECQDSSHSFQLVGVKNLPLNEEKTTQKTKSNHTFYFGAKGKPIQLSLKKYAKQKQQYLDDPSASIRQMIMGSGSSTGTKKIVKMSVNGKEITKEQMLRRLNKNKEKVKRNPIELDLLK